MPQPQDDDPLTWYLKIPWVYRLDITVGLLALGVAMVAPWSLQGSFEHNILFGPLWFLVGDPARAQLGELLIAASVPGGLLLMIGAVLFRPGIITAIVSGLGLMLWVGIGVMLAMNATI
ncbi:MAG: hypothetical protein WD045_10930 [Pirellulaceae bacterium]